MKILYMGTPDFAARILFSLIEAGEDIVGVVTQADKPQGRGYVLTPSPVKKLATEHWASGFSAGYAQRRRI